MSDNEIITEILAMYKELPCLWDKTDEDFRNKEKRYEAFSTLLVKWKTVDPDANIDTMKKKIDHMRTAFLREWKKVQDSKSSPDGIIHKPLLWYYDQLKFVRQESPTIISETDPLSDSDYQDDIPCSIFKIEQEEIIDDTPRPPKRNFMEVSASSSINGDPVTSHNLDLTDLMGQSYALQLKEMNKVQRCIAEKMIAEVLFYGKLDLLTIDSKVTLNNEKNGTRQSE